MDEIKSLKELLPSPEWLKVWLTAVKVVSGLLSTQGHYVIEHVINFVGAHSDRLLWVSLSLCIYEYVDVFFIK